MLHELGEYVNIVLKIVSLVLKLKSMFSPTKSNRPLGRKKLKKNPSRRPRPARRVKLPPPKIFVRVTNDNLYPVFRPAHLRNKRGYLYLSWRDGERVRTHYLGKAKK
jgi:hypothetical protein